MMAGGRERTEGWQRPEHQTVNELMSETVMKTNDPTVDLGFVIIVITYRQR